MGPAIWSKLSKDVKNAESICSFKKKSSKVDLEKVITEGCKNCFLCCLMTFSRQKGHLLINKYYFI